MDDGNGGTDTATVSVTVNAVNDAPDAVDDLLTTNEDTPITTGNVLGNDTDADGNALSVSGFTQPAHGSAAYNNDGTFTYTPTTDYSGSDSFTYTVDDGSGGTDTATINVTVNAVSVAPVSSGGAVGGGESVASAAPAPAPMDATPVEETQSDIVADDDASQRPVVTDDGPSAQAPPVAAEPTVERESIEEPLSPPPVDVVIATPVVNPGATPPLSDMDSPVNSGSSVSGATGHAEVTWDGTEDLGVMNPAENCDNELDLARAEHAQIESGYADAGAGGADALFGESSNAPEGYQLDEEFVLDDAHFNGQQFNQVAAAGAAQSNLHDLYYEEPDSSGDQIGAEPASAVADRGDYEVAIPRGGSDAGAQRAHDKLNDETEARRADEDDAPAERDARRNGEAGPAVAAAAGIGFFAQLWAGVRGLGRTEREDLERSGQNGTRRR